MSTIGIIYIAIGNDHLQLAIESAISVIEAGNSENILILTNVDYPRSLIISFNDGISFQDIRPNIDMFGDLEHSCLVAYLKTRLYKYSPFDKTLFLDNDIRAVSKISDIWGFVDNWIGFAPAFNPLDLWTSYATDSEEQATAQVLKIDDLSQRNSGMFLFGKSPELTKFFDNWFGEWLRFEKHENMSLTRMLKRHNIATITMPSIYNEFYPNRTNDSVLIHYISWYKRFLD